MTPANPLKKGPDPRRKVNPRKGTGIPYDVKVALRLLDQDAVDALKRVLRGRASPAAIVAAAVHVLDRTQGKVPQQVQAEVQLVHIERPPRPDAQADSTPD